MERELKYQQTSDGVHVWRYPDGDIFCAASGSQKTDTNCYPLAQQYVEGATASASPTPNPSPTGNQSGDALSLVFLIAAIVLTIVGGVALSYTLAPVTQYDPDDLEPEPLEPVGENPQGSRGSAVQGSPEVHEMVTTGSPQGQGGTSEGSDDDDDLGASGDGGSSQVQSEYVRMSIAQFREAVHPGNIDPRTLSLAEYREMAKEIVWRFYCKSGVTNRQKLAWICTGATKGGSVAWTLTDDFLKEVCPVMFKWGHSPKYTNNQTPDGGF